MPVKKRPLRPRVVWWEKRKCKKKLRMLTIKILGKIETRKILEIVVRLRILDKSDKNKRKVQPK